MVRKTKPLITGLLGLAGLGLLPQGADAAPATPALDPAQGATTAPDPSPVAVPEPSAQPAAPETTAPQTTAPQTAAEAAPQPAWTPGVEESVVAAAAVSQPRVVEPERVAASQPAELSQPVAAPPAAAASRPVAAPPVAADAAAAAEDPQPTAATPAVVPLAGPEAIAAPRATPDRPTPDPLAVAPGLDTTAAPRAARPIAAAGPGAAQPHRAAAGQPGRRFAVVTPAPRPASAVPAAAIAAPRPAPKPAAKGTSPVLAGRPGAIAPASALGFGGQVSATPARASAPAVAVRPSSPAAAPRPRAVGAAPAPDVAALRARAQAVQALLRDLRSAYALAEPGAPQGQRAAVPSDRPVAQPEVRLRGPQLPPLRSQPAPARAATTRQIGATPVGSGERMARSGLPRSPLVDPIGARPEPMPGNVALALAAPQPAMSPTAASIAIAAPASAPMAQATPTPPPPSRESLRVEPLTVASGVPSTFPPSPNAGIPSAFGAAWGDVFISASLAGADRVRPEADGSLSMGFGLGDARRLVGLELAYNLLSIRNFGSNGSFDAKVHRQVYSSDETQVAAAVGLNSFATYGSNASGLESSLYGVVSAAHLLQPDHPVNPMPITATVGLGGGTFAGEGSDVGVIAGVGLQVHPQFSVNTAWSGVGLNVGASIVPVSTLPLTLNLLYGDIGNNTRPGSVAVVSIGYGFNFAPRF